MTSPVLTVCVESFFPLVALYLTGRKIHRILIAHPGAIITDNPDHPVKASSTHHLLDMSRFSQSGYIFFLSFH